MATSSGPPSPSRLSTAVRRVAAVLTFSIAVWGAVIGTIAWRSDRAADVVVSGSGFVVVAGDALDFSNAHIAIVNHSKHSAIITNAEIWVGKRRLEQLESLSAVNGQTRLLLP